MWRLARILLLFYLFPPIQSKKLKCSYTGKVRDADNCRNYYECIDGFEVKQRCQSSQEYFSPAFSSCARFPNPPCWEGASRKDLTGARCSSANNRKFLGTSCDTYFHCKDGVFIQEDCPAGKTFSADDGACTFNDFDESCHGGIVAGTYINKESNPFEGKCRDGEFLADPLDCSLYVKCRVQSDRSYFVIEECETGKLFREETKSCEGAEDVTCGSRFRHHRKSFIEEKIFRTRRRIKREVFNSIVGTTGRLGKLSASDAPALEVSTDAMPFTHDRPFPISNLSPGPTPTPPKSAKLTQQTFPKSDQEMMSKENFINNNKPIPSNYPSNSKIIGIIKTHQKESLDENAEKLSSYPQFQFQKFPSNKLIRQKRRIKTKVRKTDTEFFDERGNFTNASTSRSHQGYSDIRPKMRVRLIETETIYYDSDEDVERNSRKNKTPEQIASKIERKLDQMLEEPPAGAESSKISTTNPGRSLIYWGGPITPKSVVKPKRRNKRPKFQQNDHLQKNKPMHYQEYEAVDGADDEDFKLLPLP